jgi:hypothetical protein
MAFLKEFQKQIETNEQIKKTNSRKEDCPVIDVCTALGTAANSCKAGASLEPKKQPQCLPSIVKLLAEISGKVAN